MTLLVAMLVLAALALLAGVLASVRLPARASDERLIARIDAVLPQTQCGRCSFSGCRPYAAAIAEGHADINQCPPGGEATVAALAQLLNRATKPIDPQFGIVHDVPRVAWIDEPACIGCTKCIQACPVDAIVGASKFMHTVIAAHCTGCELCLPPCPVDCIHMRPVASGSAVVQVDAAEPARMRA